MNRNITRAQFEELQNSLLCFKPEYIGSTLYGCKHQNSDRDLMIIYLPTERQLYDPLTKYEQYHYRDKEENMDIYLCDLISFIRNAYYGESVVNFELIWSKTISSPQLNFITDNRNYFKNAYVARSYLNFCKKDIVSFNKRKTFQEQVSGVLHIERCLKFAERLIETPEVEFTINIEDDYDKRIEELQSMSGGFLVSFLDANLALIQSLRKNLENLIKDGVYTTEKNQDIEDLMIDNIIKCCKNK